MHIPILTATALTFTFAATAMAPAAAQSAASIKRGQAIAQQQCAACHAIGRTGRSKLRNAPPLRTLAARYPLESLEEAFAEGVMVSHKGQNMPAFELSPQTINDLIAYMKSLSAKRAPR